MSAPAYGTLFRGRIVRPDVVADNYLVQLTSAAPGRVLGPIQSAVRGLAADDSVLVASLGTTQNDYVIVGRLPAPEPPALTIGDIAGLEAALDERATDAELDAVETATNLNFLVVNNKNTEQDTRLDGHDSALSALSAADTSLDGRLDTAETTNATQDGRLTTNEAAIGTLSTWEQYQYHDQDIYGDVLSAFPRALVGNQATTPTGRILWWRTRLRRNATLSKMRMGYVNAGVGGTSTMGIFRSSTPLGVYTRVSATTSAPTVGLKEYAFPATDFLRGEYIMVALLLTGQTSSVVLAVQAGAVPTGALPVLNPTATNLVWAQQNATVMPTSINPADGTWGNTATPWWLAVA